MIMEIKRARGIDICVDRLETVLGVPVTPTVATRGDGTRRLRVYAVNGGSQIQVTGRRVISKLYREKRLIGQIETNPALMPLLRELAERVDFRGVGIDLIKDGDGQCGAVDVNLAAGYRDTGLEPALTGSIIVIVSTH